jgi:hypothetical protein
VKIYEIGDSIEGVSVQRQKRMPLIRRNIPFWHD